MPERNDTLLLRDIVENAENIFQFVKDISYEQFAGDKMRVYAVVRCFVPIAPPAGRAGIGIIGEASAMVSGETKKAWPLVEWRELKDFRNHLYFIFIWAK